VLFSDDTVARFVGKKFEATWQNVREVPIVTIDFGNGNVITRTLNGNIATYACTADGQVLDILPGIYEPETYLRQLDQFAKLHRWAHQQGKDPHETMRSYHQRQSETLAKGQTALVLRVPLAVTKARIEGGVKLALYPGLPKSDETPRDVTQPRVGSTEDLARWNLLAEDTRVNESVRRLEIHRQLAEGKAVTPSAITKWLYREVLDADIDDPYLGLGKTLFASYPFKDH
jgi:hypothetical protein